MQPQRDVQLSPLTTFRLGGKARYFIEATSDDDVSRALTWAEEAHVRDVYFLGGGSNVVIADSGTSGLVVRMSQRGIQIDDRGTFANVRVAAGESFDDLVRFLVDRELVGLECLSGIPGTVGATPIQNVGAYGQEVAQCISQVVAFDRETRTQQVIRQDACQFAYRDSLFKSKAPDRYVILSVEFHLRRGEPAALRNRELTDLLARQGIERPTLRQIRSGVLELRASKSMLARPDDPNARSAGSFFVNPIVSREEAEHVQQVAGPNVVPRWDMPGDRVKLAAAWLIEHSNLPKGFRLGPVGLSPHHCLVVVAHDCCEAADVVALSHHIRLSVRDRFGVELTPEPRFWGFESMDAGLPLLRGASGSRTLDSGAWPNQP